MKDITTEELKRLALTEGLVLQGCCGNPDEWVSGVNEMLTEAGILLNGDTFKDIYIFEHEGHTNMLFSMDDVRLDVGKLAMWRLQSHDTFGGTWLSDYLPNRLGVEKGEHEPDLDGIGLDIVEPEEDAPHGHLSIRAYIVNTGDMADMYRDIDRLKDGGFAGKWHSFPTTRAEVQSTLKEIGIDGVKYMDYSFNDFEGISESLRGVLPMFTDLNELNYLAVKLEGLTNPQREVFDAVVQSGKHCASLADVINVTENLDCFDLQPAYSPEQYGSFLSEMEKDEYAGVIEKLEKSRDPDLRELVAYIERLEANIDAESYGRARASEEKGVFTDHGLLTEYGSFKEVYRGTEDIPAEYRVFALPEKEPFLKAEHTDLTSLLLKMHALGGEYMHDAHYNLNILDNRRSAEYLLLMNGHNSFLTEAAHAYRRGTTAFDFWMNAAEGSDTRAFAIHVTDMHDPRGCVIGDLVEIDLAERQRDILSHSIHFTRVDAVPRFGPDRSYTPEEWNGMEAVDRDMLQSWTRHFEHEDMEAVLRHLEDIRAEHADASKIVTPDTVLFDLSGSYMAKAENPHSDMLRVNLDVAKDMLARGGAPVYRLLPNGPELLSALDVMPSRGGLWYQNCREFAVRKDEIDGLDRWADRTTDAMIVRWQPERGKPEKPKSRGPEL